MTADKAIHVDVLYTRAPDQPFYSSAVAACKIVDKPVILHDVVPDSYTLCFRAVKQALSVAPAELVVDVACI